MTLTQMMALLVLKNVAEGIAAAFTMKNEEMMAVAEALPGTLGPK